MRKLLHSLIKTAVGYRLWAYPFKKAKMRAIQDFLPPARLLRVLDVGCGPGTNVPLFRGLDYIGVDLAPAYIRSASRRYPDMAFLQGDARRLNVSLPHFDVIVLNSLLHHMDDLQVEEVLGAVRRHVRPAGMVIAQEPLIPAGREIFPRFLMRFDRGAYFRDLDHWRRLFEHAQLRVEREQPYAIGVLRLTGWHMVSFLLRPALAASTGERTQADYCGLGGS